MENGDVKAVGGKIQVRSSMGKKGDATEFLKEEMVEAHQFVAPHATVSVGMGITVNMGNYESTRVDVHVSLPCYPAEVEKAYDEAKRIVEAKLRAEVQELRASK
jgi:hypothetical protein